VTRALVKTIPRLASDGVNNLPQAGDIGEMITAIRNVSSFLDKNNSTPDNITSISLTPGVWDVYGHGVASMLSSGASQSMTISISTVSATHQGDGADRIQLFTPDTRGAFQDMSGFQHRRLVLTSTTTVYLVGSCPLPASQGRLQGRITGIRVA